MDEAFRLGDRVAVMSGGQLLQYDPPAELLMHPADPFVSRMTGLADRALRLLSLVTAGEAALPGVAEGPAVAPTASLREVLSELVWSGADAARVVDADGTVRGRLTIADILARGRAVRVPRATTWLRFGALALLVAFLADAAELRAAVRAAHPVRRAADLRSGQPALARACAARRRCASRRRPARWSRSGSASS